jgi:branched-chain amino acid transport system substrate-binding protein
VSPLRSSLVAVFALVLLGWHVASSQMKDVAIGVIYPMSGSTSAAGVDDKPAFEIAAGIANGTLDLPFPFYQKLGGLPGLKGAKVRLVFADHRDKPEVGAAEAERLIVQDKVVALVGCWASNVTAAASLVAGRHGIPFVNPDSSSPLLTERGQKWFFRTSPHDGHFTEAMFDFFRDFERKRGVKLRRLGLTHDDSAFGKDSGKVQREYARNLDYTVVVDMEYSARARSLKDEVGRLRASSLDVWMPTSYQSHAILFTRTMKAMAYTPPMVMAQDAGHLSPDFIAEVGKDAEGYLTRAPFAADIVARHSVAKALNALYVTRAGKELYDFPARAFTGMVTLLDAMNRAGSTDAEAIRQALVATHIAGNQIPMPWENIRFDDRGQNLGARSLILQLRSGTYHTVYPFEIATMDVLYPIPSWKDRK